MHRKLIVLWSIVIVVSAYVQYKTKAGADLSHPILRVRKMVSPPKIDGKLSPKEWDDAAAFTGLYANPPAHGHFSMVPVVQQAVFYFGYDDKYIYLAMRSPHAKGTYPKATVKTADNSRICFDDHIEFQLTPHSRRDATLMGKGFYKVMVNPKGTVCDQHFYNGTDGTEDLWSLGGPAACHVTDSLWTLELAVEIKRLGLISLDGRNLVIQIVRADDPHGL